MLSLTRSKALGVIAGGATVAYSLPARSQTKTVRMAVIATDSYGQPYYALEGGFFAKAGLNVELRAFTTGGAVTTALAGGAIDVGLADPIQVGDAINRGVPFRYFAGSDVYTTEAPTTQLCVAENGSIKKPKDLVGRTLGVFGLKSMPEFATRAWLAAHGIDDASVTFAEVPPSAMVPAIKRGTIDAGVVSEPMLSRAPLSGVIAFAKVYDACAKRYYINSWFASREWLGKNTETLSRLIGAIYETARWANDHHAETLQILAKYGKLDVSDAQHMSRALFDTALDPKKVEPPLRLAWRYHGLTKALSAIDLISAM